MDEIDEYNKEVEEFNKKIDEWNTHIDEVDKAFKDFVTVLRGLFRKEKKSDCVGIDLGWGIEDDEFDPPGSEEGGGRR